MKRTNVFGWILLLGLLALTARPATDPDLWWHLRTGQWMVEHRQIPHTDPFSFTRNGSPWISQEWLSELLFFGIWRYTGWTGLIVFSAIVTTTGFMLLFWRCAAPQHWAAAATVLGALASAPTWGIRPQMFTFALASLWLRLLELSEDRPWLWVWLPPLFLLWLNLHAGFALGPALLIAYGAGLSWEALSGETEWRPVRSQALRLLLAIGICFALIPLNPSGARLYRYPLDTLRSGEMRSFISEWHSPDFHNATYSPLLILGLALLIAFALRPVRPRSRILVPLLGAFLAALDAVRHIPIFVLVAVPVIAAALNVRRPTISVRMRPGSDRTRVAAMALVLLLLALFAAVQWTKLAREQNANEAGIYPAKAVQQLASLPADRLFDYYDWGGYLIWKLYPASKVFVDGRADLYGADLLRQFQAVMQLKPGWQQILDSWDVQAVVVPSTSALAQALDLDQSWHLRYRDDDAALFLRNRHASQTPEMNPVSQAGLARGAQNFPPK